VRTRRLRWGPVRTGGILGSVHLWKGACTTGLRKRQGGRSSHTTRIRVLIRQESGCGYDKNANQGANPGGSARQPQLKSGRTIGVETLDWSERGSRRCQGEKGL